MLQKTPTYTNSFFRLDTMRLSRLTHVTENIHNLNKNDRIVGFFLYDKHREVIARISGILVEKETHRIRYIVISQGGFLDIRGKQTLVPREAFEIIDLGEVKTSWSGHSLHDAPLPEDINHVTSEEEELILSYFDLKPYWTLKKQE